MSSEIKLLSVSISNVLAIVKGLSNEKLNEIPTGYSNNLIWHVAHLLVTQKLLIYGLSGNDLGLDADFVERFRKGSKPDGVVSVEECEKIMLLFKSQLDQLEIDLKNDKFKTYKNYPTSYNFEITSLSDAIAFNNLHYGLHVGAILKMKKSIK